MKEKISKINFFDYLIIVLWVCVSYSFLLWNTAGSEDSSLKIYFVPPTPVNNSVLSANYFVVNVSIEEQNLKKVIFNFNGTNYSIYDDNLVLMFNFDNRTELGENQTFIRDLSIYERSGINIFGAIPVSSGKHHRAYQFDGIDDYISIPHSENFDFDNAPFSISLWIRTTDQGSLDTDGIINKRGGVSGSFPFWIGLRTGGKVHVSRWDGTNWAFINSNRTVNDDKWHHIVMIRTNDNKIRLYIDGTFENETADTTNNPGSNQPIFLGRGFSSNAYWYYEGLIDEVRIWNRSLSSGEIEQIYKSNLYKFNSTNWFLFSNQTNLVNGNYEYMACASNNAGNINCTGKRRLLINASSSGGGDNNFCGGSGTQADPYQICTCPQLQNMGLNLTAHYKLGNNINCSGTINWNSGQGFQPVGNCGPDNTCYEEGDNVYFRGSLNGNGYNITNLYINRTSLSGVGLFGAISNGRVYNLSLVNFSIRNAHLYIGGLAGWVVKSNFTNISIFDSKIIGGLDSGAGGVGAIAGLLSNSIVNNSYSIRVNVSSTESAGGISGEALGNSIIENSYSLNSNIYSSGPQAGGLVGQMEYSKISYSYSTGSVSGGYSVGGLVGDNLGTISYSYSTSNVSGDYSVGGLVGDSYGNISYSYSTGSVSGEGWRMGGLAGYNSGTISNSYSTGSVSGGYSVGGLVGDNLGTISNSYSTSNVSGGEGVGGLVGGNYYAMISNSFWDKVISGRTNMCGYEEYDDGAYCNDSYGKTTIQMKSFNTFSNAGWNISKTSENINNGYPFLAWQVNNSSFVWLLYEQNGGGGDFNRICKAPSFGYNYLKNKRYIKC